MLAGKEYGSGSSRDWAAKGTMLLGVRAVIAESFERIHRSNLIGMGVLPLQFAAGESAESLGLTGEETFDFGDLEEGQAKNVDCHRHQRATTALRHSSSPPTATVSPRHPRTRSPTSSDRRRSAERVSATSVTAASCRPRRASYKGGRSGAAGGRGVRPTLTAPARR